MSSALKKITDKAKQLRRSSPGMSWKSAIKKAGASYRAGKLGSVKKRVKKLGKRKVVHRKKRVVHRKKRISGIKRSSSRLNRKRVNVTMGMVGDRTVVYRGFVIVGKRSTGSRFLNKRGKVVTPKMIWQLTDGNGNPKSGGFINLATAKAWARHLSK
jgi:hypothetical protein